MKKGMIKVSKHIIPLHTNTNKLVSLDLFIDKYKSVCTELVDYIWNNEITWGKKKTTFNTKLDILNCPSMLSTTNIPLDTNLSARAVKCAATQACGIVKAATEKRRKRLYVRDKLKEENKDYSKLQEKLDKTPLVKPTIPDDFKCELNSICCDWKYIESNEFTGYLQLKSLGSDFSKFKIPIKFHRQANKWKEVSKQLNSFLISKNYINIRWNYEPEKKKTGRTVGADTGKLDVVNFSNKDKTPKTDEDKHSLNSILAKLSRKKKGSKGFQKAQEHRRNFINWSINQLNLKELKQINLEQINNIRFQKRCSREMSHWTHKEIQDKMLSIGEEHGVRVKLQSSMYRSQRCSKCGFVHQKNRKGKVFHCLQCKYSEDADYNASCNHEIELPEIPRWLYKLHLNRGEGFYWKTEGFYSLAGLELTVPDDPKA